MFITFEGIDGCGKSTQIQLTYEWLSRMGMDVVLTREPGGTYYAEMIREVILKPVDEPVAPTTELLLYAAARAQHVATKIKPALDAGKIVLCDRFYDSTFALQGYGLGYSLDLIHQVNDIATGGLKPDLTLLFDINPFMASYRMKTRGDKADRIEQRGLEYQRKVHDGYMKIASYESTRVVVVDATFSIEVIQEKVRDIISSRSDV